MYDFDDIDETDIYNMNKGKGSMYLKPDQTKKYPDMISFENPRDAKKSAKDLRKEFKNAKQRDKKRKIAIITQDCANQSGAFLKRKDLSNKERNEFKKIHQIYSVEAKSMWASYNKEYNPK